MGTRCNNNTSNANFTLEAAMREGQTFPEVVNQTFPEVVKQNCNIMKMEVGTVDDQRDGDARCPGHATDRGGGRRGAGVVQMGAIGLPVARGQVAG